MSGVQKETWQQAEILGKEIAERLKKQTLCNLSLLLFFDCWTVKVLAGETHAALLTNEVIKSSSQYVKDEMALMGKKLLVPMNQLRCFKG